MNQVSLPSYSAEAFVNRDAEVGLVSGLARQIAQGIQSPDLARTVIIRGERGSGKTWLSLHLHRTILPPIQGLRLLFLNLFLDPDTSRLKEKPRHNEWFATLEYPTERPSPQDLCQRILIWIAQQNEIEIVPGAELRDISQWVTRGLEKRIQNQPLVLILDSVFETDWSFLEQLETYLLAPLAASPKVLIVMTGRGRLYPWISPYLRINTKNKLLEPFEKKDIQQQLAQQAPQATRTAEEILELGGGFPMNNVLLAQALSRREALDLVTSQLLSILPKEKRGEIRKYFEGLCVLEGFRDDEIAELLPVYLNQTASSWNTDKVRQARESMLDTHLVRWENSHFVMDTSIRTVLNHYLYEADATHETWKQLHRKAHDLYLEWARKYPRHDKYYKERARYHAEQLKKKEIRLEEIPTSSRDPDNTSYAHINAG